MKQRLTQWIDGKFKPELDGVYQRDYSYVQEDDLEITFCLFNHGKWRIFDYTVELANEELEASSYQNLPWRGLAEKPKGKK